MWLPVKVTTPPATEPVTPEAAKRQLNVLHNDDDNYIGELIEAARDHVEKYCGAYIGSQTVEAQATNWADMSRVPALPLDDASIVYTATDGTATTLPTAVYEVRGDGLVLKYGQQWPAMQSGSLITVTATCGFAECPPAVRHAMLLWIADAYENRETGEQMPSTTFDALLANYRFYG